VRVGDSPQPVPRPKRDRVLLGVFHVEHQPMLSNMPATGQATRTAPPVPHGTARTTKHDSTQRHAGPVRAGAAGRPRRAAHQTAAPCRAAGTGIAEGRATQTTAPPAYGEGGRPLATTSFAAARATRRPAPAALRHAQPLPGGADPLGMSVLRPSAHRPGTSPISRTPRGAPGKEPDLTSATGGTAQPAGALQVAGQGTGRRRPLVPRGAPGRERRPHERYRWHGAAGRSAAGA
jgi:hypothetical protein